MWRCRSFAIKIESRFTSGVYVDSTSICISKFGQNRECQIPAVVGMFMTMLPSAARFICSSRVWRPPS